MCLAIPDDSGWFMENLRHRFVCGSMTERPSVVDVVAANTGDSVPIFENSRL